MRILIVDDDLESARLLESILLIEGHNPFVAHGVQEALDRWTIIRPDIVISDNRMPGQTGIEMVRYLRTRETLPIIMLTSNLTPALEHELTELGVTGLSKVDINKLPSLLADLEPS